ncbi:hypothetical protein [Nonomuraea insulae]|uniref:Uncharacterized protein n=1 Tax=Nonomuraea insulae TaxID=1616787 RepID=A0ABW1CUF8_9ACTN
MKTHPDTVRRRFSQRQADVDSPPAAPLPERTVTRLNAMWALGDPLARFI